MSWVDSPKNVTRLYTGLWVTGVLLVLADLMVHRHAETAFDGWLGAYGVYGFGACVLLVLAAKLLRRVVMREEDYYDR
jgi:hypothetical protein